MSDRAILWVDDDDPERFLFEELSLEDLGWKVFWAHNLDDAVQQLSERPFDAVLLDQDFPPNEEHNAARDVWSGCRILFWLRGDDLPGKAPPSPKSSKILEKWRPHSGNGDTPVCMVTAFYNDETEQAAKKVGNDRLRIVRKPIRIEEIENFLNAITGNSENNDTV